MKSKLSLLLGALLLSALLIVPAIAQDDDPPAPDSRSAFCTGTGPGQAMGFGRGGGFGKGMSRGHGAGFGPMMAEQLELTDAQKEQLADMRAAHQKEMIRQRAEMKIARLELQELFRSDADRGQITSKVEQIGKLEIELDKARVAHRLDMRDILTPEQRDKLKDLPPLMGQGFRGDCDDSGPHGRKAPRGGRFGRGQR